MSDNDSISVRISEDCPPQIQRMLTAAWAHDVDTVKKLIDTPEVARGQDPKTGESPLHAAIRSCGAPSEDDTPEDLEKAKATVSELLMWGAIWNDVDNNNETPGCVAARLNRPELYELCVNAGVRAEMLFGLMDGYEALDSDDDDDEEMAEGEEAQVEDGEEAPELVAAEEATQTAEEEKPAVFQPPAVNLEEQVTSDKYLRSTVAYSDGKLVDDAGNGVMMAWETDIMRRSVDALLPNKEPGKRILNIGFGMGIIDGMFAETKPAVHHIIEAHPEVLEYISTPESKFDSTWEESGPAPGAYRVWEGKWQQIGLQLLEEGHVYDAIYFDTFGEDYGQLRMFFTEYIPGLLDSNGIFGFFNGLGADRQICYDVYTKVSEMHLADAGLDVEWKEIPVDMKELAEADKDGWEGVKRRYWTLDSKSPTFRFCYFGLLANIPQHTACPCARSSDNFLVSFLSLRNIKSRDTHSLPLNLYRPAFPCHHSRFLSVAYVEMLL